MTAPLKITFDSNTWRRVATPDNFPKDMSISDYRIINKCVKAKIIIPFISETVFTLEAIKRADRKEFFKSYSPNFSTTLYESPDGKIGLRLTMSSDIDAHPGNNEIVKEHLADAIALGFNIISVPRISGVMNKEVEPFIYKIDGALFRQFEEVLDKVLDRMRELKAGEYEIIEIGKRYDTQNPFNGIGKAPEHENGNIASAVAEWADGDSVAAHIATGGDYFCTLDVGKSASSNSVLNPKNVAILNSEFGFKTITPASLSHLLSKYNT